MIKKNRVLVLTERFVFQKKLEHALAQHHSKFNECIHFWLSTNNIKVKNYEYIKCVLEKTRIITYSNSANVWGKLKQGQQSVTVFWYTAHIRLKYYKFKVKIYFIFNVPLSLLCIVGKLGIF